MTRVRNHPWRPRTAARAPADRTAEDRRGAVSRRRRALSHPGGPVSLRGGNNQERSILEHALTVTADESVVMAHVHGFHSYPARMHPETATRLVRGLSKAQEHVLDPFCGSGTVVVESRLAGRRATGVDLNPLAVELTWLKSGGLAPGDLPELASSAQEVTLHAEARRSKKAGPSRRYGRADRELFSVHVLLELDGLRHGIETLAPRPPIRRALGLVLSSLLTKVSLRAGDTSERLEARRLAAGYTVRLFQRRTELLARQLEEFWEKVPPATPPAQVELGDARHLSSVPPASVDLVVTSPPYPGLYDYHAQHAVRMRWLGLDSQALERAELGAKRRLLAGDPENALAEWERELRAVLGALGRVVRPSGVVAVVLGDSVLGGRAVRGDETLERVASSSSFRVAAIASQPRPHFHTASARVFSREPRAEHLVLLRAMTGRQTGGATGSGGGGRLRGEGRNGPGTRPAR
jgi:SAM-dependent methyltransferase